jgi:phosphoribulokinase
MSEKHPIIAVTGMAGAGLSTVRHAFKDLFSRDRTSSPPSCMAMASAAIPTASSPRCWKKRATAIGAFPGSARNAIISRNWNSFSRPMPKPAAAWCANTPTTTRAPPLLGVKAGEFTPWKPLNSRLGPAVLRRPAWRRDRQYLDPRQVDSRHFPPEIDRRVGKPGIDVAQHVDLLIGVVPAINLEWIQKIHRDCAKGRTAPEDSLETILRRMDDYIHYIVPQFGLTDINIQRMPLVDTSNPFIARDVPTPDESVLVIHFRDRKRHDFPALLRRIPGSRMTRPTTMLVPGGELRLALSVICGPLVEEMMEKQRPVARVLTNKLDKYGYAGGMRCKAPVAPQFPARATPQRARRQ